jgi:acyl dehydratase
MHRIEDLQRSVGRELEPSGWFLIDQQRVNRFAEVSEQADAWSHTDPARAAALGGTTVQGLLLLTMLPHLLHPHLALPEGCSNGLNYGFDRLRFINVVRVGKRVRARARLAEFSPYREGWWKKTLDVTLDIEGEQKPALRTDWIMVYM